jgi:protein tyrosine phosphatase (PTP) superfamily phosphohydrolase (DUF442 family)
MFIYVLTFLLNFFQVDLKESLNKIQAFHFINENLASSGMIKLEEYKFINDYGFKHVINLLPGNQIKEKATVQSYGMTYTQIAVDFNAPTMENLEEFVKKMNELKGQKIYVHCAANMRASSFIFVYRVTQLKEDKKIAKKDLDFIWYPQNQWFKFISDGLQKYNVDTEYRFESSFIKSIRKDGVAMAIKTQKESKKILFEEKEIEQLIREYSSNKEKNAERLLLMTLRTQTYTQSWQAFLQLAEEYVILDKKTEAISAFKKVIELNPSLIWPKRILGKLDVLEFKYLWVGKNETIKSFQEYLGKFSMGEDEEDFVEVKVIDNKIKLITGWNNVEHDLFFDNTNECFIQKIP